MEKKKLSTSPGRRIYFSIKMCSRFWITVCGLRDIACRVRSSIRFVFQRNPKKRRYLTVSASTIESRFFNTPVNWSSVSQPSKSYQASPQWTATAGTRIESRVKITVSRGADCNSIIVSDCALLTADKSRFRRFSSLIIAASSARNRSNSFTVSSSDSTRAALKESRTLYRSTSVSRASVFALYLEADCWALFSFTSSETNKAIKTAEQAMIKRANFWEISISVLLVVANITIFSLHPSGPPIFQYRRHNTKRPGPAATTTPKAAKGGRLQGDRAAPRWPTDNYARTHGSSRPRPLKSRS